MKLFHVPFGFFPDPVGGTEVYVAALAGEQRARGVEAVIVAPGPADASYQHQGLPVRRFAVSSQVTDIGELYGPGDAPAAERFGRLLDAERPDLVHLHAFTRGVSLNVLREARRHGLPVVFTYHTPAVSCQRGTLLRWGTTICDGRLRPGTCTACTLHGLGLPRPASELVARVPVAVGELAGRARRSGGGWTALRMRALMTTRFVATRALFAEVDALVVLAEWTRTLLLRMGVPPAKLTLSRHGLQHTPVDSVDATRATNTPLRIAFLGRLHPSKGVDLLIDALRRLPAARLTLDIFGVVQEGAGDYARALQRQAAEDARIRLLEPAPGSQVVELLAQYDLLAVPSRALETGPLVVLEAFTAGIPVVGAALGGIAELVTDGHNGLLVAPQTADVWAQVLERLAADPELVQRLRGGVRPPRAMAHVATEMLALYAALGQS